jgi:DNA-binding response OmpR family regulator
MAKVLVVEAVRTLRSLYQFDLERDGHEILTASTPAEAVELLENERPQVVVLDSEESGMKGVEAMMRVHDRTAAVRVVVISTLGGAAGEWRRSTADAFLVRSSALQDLRETVRSVLRRSRGGAVIPFRRR